MLGPSRSHSVQFPRPKIYLAHLNQLIDRRIVIQPEIQVNNKLFPHRNFARKLSTSHQRTKSSIQLRSQKFDLHWSSKQSKPIPSIMKNEPKQRITQIKLELPRTKSTQLPLQREQPIRFYSTYTGIPKNSSPQPQVITSTHSPQKNFLKRGSNIQKQIVVNLLRNKIIREREFKEKKEYSNSQIIKMIQVFKGVTLEENKKSLFVNNIDKAQIKRQNQREIKGWDQDVFNDYQINQQKQ